MAKKLNFTDAEDKRASLVMGSAAEAQEIKEIERAQAQEIREIEQSQEQEKRKWNRLDPRDPAPKQYRFNARMDGLLGKYLNQKAWLNHASVTATLEQIVREDMERHPEILESLDELNK